MTAEGQNITADTETPPVVPVLICNWSEASLGKGMCWFSSQGLKTGVSCGWVQEVPGAV